MTVEQAAKWDGDAGVAFDRCCHKACPRLTTLIRPGWMR
jgi:hypothetical protein